MLPLSEPVKGRGASDNPANRFETIRYEACLDAPDDERPAPATQFLRDRSRTLIATNDSPDIFFEASINPYRGCEHGCIYCYARPYHEYLGFSIGLDFETKILVKEDAVKLLRHELSAPRWQPKVLGISGVTDPYQPIERSLKLTRGCLEVLADFRNPVALVTKNHLITRDLDFLTQLAMFNAVHVAVAVTTLDAELARCMEPRATQPHGRLQAIRELSEAGIATTVLLAPIIPGLTDHEIPGILAAAREAGAQYAGYTMLRLPHGLGDLFGTWLDQHYPDRKEKILGRVKEMRGGQLNDPRFGVRMRGEGPLAEAIHQMFQLAWRKHGYTRAPALSTAHFHRPNETPPSLFDGIDD